jgi:hypothetical protein
VADAFPVLFSRPGPSPIIGVTMYDPVTQLDQRFSDPDANPTTWAAAGEVLEAAQISWISTVRATGARTSPRWSRCGSTERFTSPPARPSRAVNLRTNPNVVLTTGCNTWDRGLDVVVEGEARRVTDRATLQRLAAAWTGGRNGTAAGGST